MIRVVQMTLLSVAVISVPWFLMKIQIHFTLVSVNDSLQCLISARLVHLTGGDLLINPCCYRVILGFFINLRLESQIHFSCQNRYLRINLDA